MLIDKLEAIIEFVDGLVLAKNTIVKELEVKIHFACLLGFEGAGLEVECDEGLEEAMVKEQVHEIFLGAKGKAMLAANVPIEQD